MRGCADRVEDDLDVLLLEKDPNVRSCVGPATRAVCEVETVEWWAPCGDKTPGPRRIKKTAPLGPWDCTRRHVPSGKPGWVMKFLIDGKANGATYALLRREVDKASPADRKLIDEMGFVASLLNQRQALVDAQ
jgi:hypothetical protein